MITKRAKEEPSPVDVPKDESELVKSDKMSNEDRRVHLDSEVMDIGAIKGI